MLKGRRILIAVSGGIAAYKTPFVIRELIKRGAEVRVIVTENAQRFVTPQTLSTVSGNKVYSEMFCEIHIENINGKRTNFIINLLNLINLKITSNILLN